MQAQTRHHAFLPSFRPAERAGITAALIVGGLISLGGMRAEAQGLQVTYGTKGVQTLAYNGITLEDTAAFGSDTFHIWHMRATDLAGNVLTTGQSGWGENNNGTSWNSQNNTETYNFAWGTVATQFVQNGNRLDIIVTETNYGSSGIVFDGAEIFPLALHFPQDPKGFNGYTQYVVTTTDPGVSVADFGSGVVTAVVPDEAVSMYTGWKSAGANAYTPIMTGTAPDGLASFLPSVNAPVQPGASFSYTVSLRFTDEGTPADVADALTSFAKTYPSQMTWSDKRILGTAYLASSPAGSDATQPGGFPTNPRRYFNDAGIDVTTAAGLQSFQNRMLAQAASNAANAKNMNAQGVITWDVEGEQYPQTTSYVCSPDQIAAVAPEMESAIADSTSPYFGQKLDDAYFKTISAAGLKVGLCLRPQVFTLGPNGTASQVSLTSNASIISNLENKARYANTRWGATIFYVDSTVNPLGGTLDPAIFQQLITDLPNVLFIPEESNTRYYAYSAPFYSFIFHTTTGTADSVYGVYPNAFGANLVNDVNASTLANFLPQLTRAVGKGDILMGHADYWQENDPTLVSIYAAAGVSAPTPVPVPTPTPTTPAILWPAPAAVVYGTALSASQLDATATVPGTFTYSPSLGTVPGAGTTKLTVTFTPANTTLYKAGNASVQLTVAQATPTITWAAPATLSYGTALSAAQLNATASVPGSFTYAPGTGAVLAPGLHVVRATFTPADTADFNPVSASVNVQVNQATATVSWASPGAITYGTRLSAMQLNAKASVPGTFSYSPAAGTVLAAGTRTLTAKFTPTDSGYAAVTTTRTLTVKQAAVKVSWPTAASLKHGAALSDVQLNATASVEGSFTYSPRAGTVLSVGNHVLKVLFMPADAPDYRAQVGSLVITVHN